MFSVRKIFLPKYFVFCLPWRRLSCFSVLYGYPIRRWVSRDETSRRTTEEEGEEALTESHSFIVFAETRGKVINHLLMMMETMVKSSTDNDVIVAELPAFSSLLCLCWRCVRFWGVSSGALADGGVSVVSLSQERTTIRPTTCWEKETPQCAWRPVSASTTSTMAASCSTAHSRRE